VRSPLDNTELDTSVARYLRAYWLKMRTTREDHNQPPELTVGFKGLRKIHMLKLAKECGVDLGENAAQTPATQLVVLMEMAWNQGKFPPLPKPEDEVAALRQELAEMKQMMTGKGLTTSREINPDAPSVPYKPEEAITVQTEASVDINSLDWNDLRRLAKEKGVPINKPTGTGMRLKEEIVKDLTEALYGDNVPSG